ncbi:TetR/AcrR family transcriptional regulator [Microbacterium terrisoli]|uniref:TetR/AcrR family transcriptional regulator n=1 Tax=Microbacterium terrisoli TaxID=3242192 RepID=UPI0028044098|nr:TetR family transcriptional regulator [Microbacterium protaetiae]
MTTRERALHAAVHLVGTDGVRALTHGRVDAAAGLPAGSTSNHFRTRAALVGGVVAWIADSERADFAGAGSVPASIDDFVDMLTAMVEQQTSAHAERTRARYALFLESGPAEVQTVLRTQRAQYEVWLQSLLAGLDMPDPADAARAIMACAEGLVLHRLTVDPAASVRPSIERIVRGCLHRR